MDGHSPDKIGGSPLCGLPREREAMLTQSRRRSFVFFLLLPLGICLLLFAILICIEKNRYTGDLVEMAEWRLYDWRLRGIPRSGRHYPDPAIAIIELDEESFSKIPEPSFLWVVKYTRLLRMLSQAGAKVTGFDYLQMNTPDEFVLLGIDNFIDRLDRPESERKGLKDLIKSYSPRFDNELGLIIGESRTVLATMIDEKRDRYQGSHREIEMFAGDDNLASINIVSEKDGVVRKISSQWTDRTKKTLPSFSFLVAQRYLNEGGGSYTQDFADSILFYDDHSMLINYVGPAKGFAYHSFRSVDERAKAGDLDFFQTSFRGKIVLIGATDVTLQDLKLTPFNEYRREYPGVEIHASAINTILHRDFIRRVSPFWRYATLLILMTIYFLVGYKLSFGRSLLAGLLIGLLYWWSAFFLFQRHNLWIDLALPTASIPVILFASFAYRALVMESDRKWLHTAFCRYVSKSIADEISRNPEMVKLGGEEREITVLFSDINHFTPLSEKWGPPVIVRALNEYFTLMEEVIFAHGGTLKQFVGDEIMVIFGAPTEQKDHSVQAVLTALDMISKLAEWQKKREEEGDFHFDIKIGIHCGTALVGNVGSPYRTEYTALGDMVNTTSRIMGLNKSLGTSILISEEIFKRVESQVVAEDKGTFKVKGKDQEVHIYALLGRKPARA